MEHARTESTSAGFADPQAAIDARIESFSRPASLPPEVAGRVLPRLRELTRRAGPTSADDARNLLTAGCRLLADVHAARDGELDVDAVLTDATVAAWSHTAKRGLAEGTLANYLRFLNRLVRAAKGLPPRAVARRSRNKSRVLLAHDALFGLAGRLVGTDPEAAATLVAAAGAGLVATTTAVGFERRDGAFIAVQDEKRMPVTSGWHELAGRLLGVTGDAKAWARMRAAARDAGLALNGPVLRFRWAVDGATAAATPLEAVRAMPGELLSTASRHLPAVEGDAARNALRGGGADCRAGDDGHGPGRTGPRREDRS